MDFYTVFLSENMKLCVHPITHAVAYCAGSQRLALVMFCIKAFRQSIIIMRRQHVTIFYRHWMRNVSPTKAGGDAGECAKQR